MDLSGQIFKATLQAKNSAEGVAKRPKCFFSQPLSLPCLIPHLGVLQAALPMGCPGAGGPSHSPGTARFSLQQASHSLFHGDIALCNSLTTCFHTFSMLCFFNGLLLAAWFAVRLDCSPEQPLPQRSLAGREGNPAPTAAQPQPVLLKKATLLGTRHLHPITTM